MFHYQCRVNLQLIPIIPFIARRVKLRLYVTQYFGMVLNGSWSSEAICLEDICLPQALSCKPFLYCAFARSEIPHCFFHAYSYALTA